MHKNYFVMKSQIYLALQKIAHPELHKLLIPRAT